MNQIHLVIGRHRSDHASFNEAISAIRRRVLLRRFLDLLEDETVLMLRAIFE